MRVVAIIQARMGASRLPGKVMRQLCGSSVLAQVIRRASACQHVAQVVVATTTERADAEVAEEARRYDIAVFRGSEEDVLGRYYGAAVEYQADVILRISADCPLLDPALLDELLRVFKERAAAGQPLDYLSNNRVPSYPKGLDAEVFGFGALKRAHDEAKQAYEREHVTPYIYMHPDKFRIDGIRQAEDQSAHRWTLDTEDDWRYIHAVYRLIGCDRRIFGMAEVLDLLERQPELQQLNSHVRQKRLGE